jgi:hypothetical protein
VLELAGRPHEATALLHEALARYERKEALLEPDRIHEPLAAMSAGAVP